uniref:ER membrane protein complex subunit 2 n=1 Tax=Fopius arisanus TaxID=64838 RepID=A0A0C9QBU0_9HYME
MHSFPFGIIPPSVSPSGPTYYNLVTPHSFGVNFGRVISIDFLYFIRLFSCVSVMAKNQGTSWTEARDQLRTWRENSDRKSREIVGLWDSLLVNKVENLGNEKYLVLEQVCVAALDCYRLPLAEYCIKILMRDFPGSLRVHKYHVMHLEALEM